MLQLIIPDSDELWDEKKEEFVYRKGQTLQLEHSCPHTRFAGQKNNLYNGKG